MTSIIESLLAAFKDFHWLVSIDTLLIFFVNYLMFHAAGRVKISWWLHILRYVRQEGDEVQFRVGHLHLLLESYFSPCSSNNVSFILTKKAEKICFHKI